MGIDLEINLEELGQLPLYPPRRRLIDLIPTFIMSWVRRRYSRPLASPRETWAVKSLMLRVAYGTQLVSQKIEEIPAAYFQHKEAGTPKRGTISGLNTDVEWSSFPDRDDNPGDWN